MWLYQNVSLFEINLESCQKEAWVLPVNDIYNVNVHTWFAGSKMPYIVSIKMICSFVLLYCPNFHLTIQFPSAEKSSSR
jgi:hypothetical protein